MPSSTTTPQSPHLSANRAQSALMEGLQPALRSTLSSLNINLDYELARYRYAKRGETPPGAMPSQFQPRRRALNLMTVPPRPPQPSQPPQAVASPPSPPPNPRLQRVESPPGTTASPSEVAALRSAIVQQSPLSPDSDLASAEALWQTGFDTAAATPRPESAAAPSSRSWASSIMTPLGLGGLMLLLVASAGFGFVLVNPSAASHLFQNTPLARFFPSEEEADAIAEAETETGDAAIAESDGPPLTALGPDLSQQEFTDLDLNDLSTLPSSSSSLSPEVDALTPEEAAEVEAAARDRLAAEPSTMPRESTTNEPQRVNQIPTRTTPAPRPATPTYTEPAPAPRPAAPAPAAETPTQPAPPVPQPQSDSQAPVSSYYVVTDYTGDPSLDEARSAVDEAYVRNFDTGARIQMGAFNTPEGAAALAEELRNQGIEAEIYEP